MKTSHQAVLTALETASRTLPRAEAPALPPDIAAWVEQIPFSDICVADQICDIFASKREWPPMENDVLAQIHLRVDAAIDVTREMLRRRADVPPPDPMESALKSVLIDFWHGKGIEWVCFRFGDSPPPMEGMERN